MSAENQELRERLAAEEKKSAELLAKLEAAERKCFLLFLSVDLSTPCSYFG